MKKDDAPSVLALARTLEDWFNPQGLVQMGRDLPSQGGYVAARGEVLLGFVAWSPVDRECAELSWMGVAEDEQRKGVGTALLSALVAELRVAGYRCVEVSTVADTVPYEPYAITRRFYRARGFSDHRVDRGYWGEGDDRYDRLVLRLSLSPEREAPTSRRRQALGEGHAPRGR
jgi:GNAT superfamily N-acetyltransferase